MTLKDGTIKEINAIFSDAYNNAERSNSYNGGHLQPTTAMTTTVPKLVCRRYDANDIVQGNTVVIPERGTYRVMDNRKNGDLAQLYLHKVS